MTPTTLETCTPGFLLWCPTFGELREVAPGDFEPTGLAWQVEDVSDPIAEADAFAEKEGVWGYLHKVNAPGDTVAVCRVPESEEDVAVGKPRCFAGMRIVRGTGGASASVRTSAVKLAVVDETVTWDAARKMVERKPADVKP